MTLFSAVAAVEDATVERYLAEQADLTAVERFASRHEADVVPLQAKYYRDLIPFGRPEPGQQYAFAVDLDACTGCKACVAACHSLNGLDDGESWRSVRLLTGGTQTAPVQQTVTAACHHCIEPACLTGCPVDAYEKDPLTGIVAHLDDQCIGCGYCTLTCPYEVPVLSKDRGIVRKCDMCQGRLAAGEAPACVQACPNEAIAITLVEVATARSHVPAGPPASITLPTSVYLTERADVASLAAIPSTQVGPARAHTPLAVMLVLTQLAVGAFATDLVARPAGTQRALDAVIALGAGAVALAASVLHLGRPRYCYRAVIGWRHSWLSREVLAFGAFTGLAGPYAVLVALGSPLGRTADGVLAVLALVAGLAGIACSVLIYTTTHRSSWRPLPVSVRFLSTSAVCGLSAVPAATYLSTASSGGAPPLARALEGLLAMVAAAKLLVEAVGLRPSMRTQERGRRTHLLLGDLRTTTRTQFACGAAGGVAVPAVVLIGRRGSPYLLATLAVIGALAVVAGELAERRLFFTTASPPQ